MGIFGAIGSIFGPAGGAIGSLLDGGSKSGGGIFGKIGGFISSIFGGKKEMSALGSILNGFSAVAARPSKGKKVVHAVVRQQPNGQDIKAAADKALANNSGPKAWDRISKEIDDRLTQMDIEGNKGKEATEERELLQRLKKVAVSKGSIVLVQVTPQENGFDLQKRANRALANNAGPEEWKKILEEVKDRKDQIKLNGTGNAPTKESEMDVLNRVQALAEQKIGGNTGKATTETKEKNTGGNETAAETKAGGTENTENTKAKSTDGTESKEETKHKCSDSTQSKSTDYSKTADKLNDLVNEARHAYTGNDPEVKKALSNIENLDDKLQTALNEKPQNLEKIKALTEKLSNALDKLGNKFPADSKMAKLLGKAEASAEKLFGEVKTAIADMAKIKETADKLNDKINESKHAYVGKMPDDIKADYAKLEKADDKLQRAIAAGKSPAEIRKLAIEVSNLADKLGNKLAADPKQGKAAAAMKSAEGLAEKLIGESSGTTPPQSPENPPKADSAISVDQNAKTIRIDADKDGKADYEVKMMGKGQAWEVTQLSTGEKFKVWGDPHVDLNSQNKDGTTRDFDFKNTSTFVLPGVNGSDDVKITVGTTAYKNGNKTVTDTLTITTGDDAVKVTGIADNKVKIGKVTNDGEAVDAATNDGHIFRSGDHINDMQIMTEDGTFEDADADKKGTDMHAEGKKTYEYNG